jgi:K+-transporting ATPase A subunit
MVAGMETHAGPSVAVLITRVTLGTAFVVAAIVLLVLWQGRGLGLINAFLAAIITFFFAAIAVGVVLSALSPILLKRQDSRR